MAELSCQAPGCTRRPHGSHWCSLHYQRMRNHGTLDLPSVRCRGCGRDIDRDEGRRRCNDCRPQRCVVPLCERPRYQNRLRCSTHVMRLHRYGSVDAPSMEVVCECGVVFTAVHSKRKYCSPKCFFHFASQRGPRRAHHRGQYRIKRLRPVILARDGSVCHICLGAIDQSLAFPHPLSLTIDHVIPVSVGGTDEIENLRPAHLSCNVAKSDDLPTWWERGAVA